MDHSAALNADVNEVWDKLQVERLHNDPRVIRSNMKAAKIVSELFLLVAIFPELVPGQFYREHARLWNGAYLDFYRKLLTPKVGLPAKLVEFLPLDRYIGLPEDLRTNGASFQIAVEKLIMAKDYVASLSDDQARQFHAEYLG